MIFLHLVLILNHQLIFGLFRFVFSILKPDLLFDSFEIFKFRLFALIFRLLALSSSSKFVFARFTAEILISELFNKNSFTSKFVFDIFAFSFDFKSSTFVFGIFRLIEFIDVFESPILSAFTTKLRCYIIVPNIEVEPNSTRIRPAFMASIIAFRALSVLASCIKRTSWAGIP